MQTSKHIKNILLSLLLSLSSILSFSQVEVDFDKSIVIPDAFLRCLHDESIFKVTSNNHDSYEWRIGNKFATPSSTLPEFDTSILDSLLRTDIEKGRLTGPRYFYLRAFKGNDIDIDTSFYVVTNLRPVPKPNLGLDTAICYSSDSVYITDQTTYSVTPEYFWRVQKNGKDTLIYLDQNSLWVKHGKHVVHTKINMGENFTCKNSDTINIDELFHNVDLGPDRDLCTGDTVQLKNLSQNQPDYKIEWSTIGNSTPLADRPDFNIHTPDDYVLTLRHKQFPCAYKDTVHLTFHQSPMVNLQQDTSVCEGQYITLKNLSKSHDLGGDYKWQVHDSVLYYQNSFDSKQLGKHYLSVKKTYTTPTGDLYCTTKDSMLLDLGLNNADLGKNDIPLCENDTIIIRNQKDLTQAKSIIWNNDPNLTIDSLTFTGSGTASIKVETEYINISNKAPYRCVFEDNVTITAVESPKVDLVGEGLEIDLVLCRPFELKNKLTDSINDVSTHIWNNNPDLNSKSLMVKDSGKYELKLISPDGCQSEDVTIIAILHPFSLGEDTTTCLGDTVTLSPDTKQIPNSTYTWNGTLGDVTLAVNETGDYNLKISHPKALNNCYVENDRSVTFKQGPTPDFGGDITSKEEVTLDGTFDNTYPENEHTYEWVDISTGEIISNESSYYVEKTKEIKLTITELLLQCSGKDSLLVTINKDKSLFVPTAFSPASTIEENKVFKVLGTAIDENDFKVMVYDRWGNLMFESSDFNFMSTTGWDGKMSNGKTIPGGTYGFSVKATYEDGESVKKTGSVTYIP